MSYPTPTSNFASELRSTPHHPAIAALSTLELAQILAERLAIGPQDWHQLKANRQARSLEQAASALVYLLKQQPEEALPRLQQAVGWLDRSLTAPPCPTHGQQKSSQADSP
ncbi:DUF6439 family protein [Trichothermofontia sichuanensis B231]|uniref:DUF6439 family protein n=1 Tax=Trichothermofontia sichuanensis TaxID=3045816 RepID=UPI0022479EAD|nr:DUF6439 family protein [Trichothermofontia sichuanensis]UZQ53201.1 DUF6439 family protein [Trichothermofontia sichuanensis B231]